MEIYTPSKKWFILGLFSFVLAIFTITNHAVLDVIAGTIIILTGILYVLLGLGKISYVELSSEYLIYHSFFRLKKWRIEEIHSIAKTKKNGNTIYVYKGTECIRFISYSDRFIEHLERVAKNAKVR